MLQERHIFTRWRRFCSTASLNIKSCLSFRYLVCHVNSIFTKKSVDISCPYHLIHYHKTLTLEIDFHKYNNYCFFCLTTSQRIMVKLWYWMEIFSSPRRTNFRTKRCSLTSLSALSQTLRRFYSSEVATEGFLEKYLAMRR